jgi:hypothetical protein
MAGLVPAIHEFPCTHGIKDVDARHEAGHDEVRGYSAASAIRFGS